VEKEGIWLECIMLCILRSYYSKLFSDCSYPLMLNCIFIVLSNITEVSILSGINLMRLFCAGSRWQEILLGWWGAMSTSSGGVE